MPDNNKMGDSRQTGTQAPRSLELRLAVVDMLGNSDESAVRSLGSCVSVSCLGL